MLFFREDIFDKLLLLMCNLCCDMLRLETEVNCQVIMVVHNKMCIAQQVNKVSSICSARRGAWVLGNLREILLREFVKTDIN